MTPKEIEIVTGARRWLASRRQSRAEDQPVRDLFDLCADLIMVRDGLRAELDMWAQRADTAERRADRLRRVADSLLGSNPETLS